MPWQTVELYNLYRRKEVLFGERFRDLIVAHPSEHINLNALSSLISRHGFTVISGEEAGEITSKPNCVVIAGQWHKLFDKKRNKLAAPEIFDVIEAQLLAAGWEPYHVGERGEKHFRRFAP